MRILLTRTDSIGDVVLTLPMASVIKEHLSGAEVYFLGKTYTRDVVECYSDIDGFLNWDDYQKLGGQEAAKKIRAFKFDVVLHVFPVKEIGRIMKKAGIPVRIATASRVYMWPYCNKHVRFSRKRSELHESQLNLKLLRGINIEDVKTVEELGAFYKSFKAPESPEKVRALQVHGKKNIILHPKSKGSSVEWGLENFNALINLLPEKKFQIFISGTEEDKNSIGDRLPLGKPNVVSLLGNLSLKEFISFISLSDGLIAASTGPLHIASALGIKAIGLYSPRMPIHPGRWMPIGEHAKTLVFDPNCEKCAAGKDCDCIRKVSPQRIVDILNA